MTPKRPVLRWHGGKWRSAPWILEHFPPHRIYTEAFGGAGSVLLQKPRVYAEVYNDLDGEVVNVFRVLRDTYSATELERKLRMTPFAREEFKLSYEPTTEPIERARRTIIRSFMGFGSSSVTRSGRGRGMRTRASTWSGSRISGFRGDTKRSGTTPAHDWSHWPNCIKAYVARLAGVVIENKPGVEVITQHDRPDSLHYVDPPYVASTRDSNHEYRHEMTDDQHRDLAAVLHSLKGMVVLSGYPSPLYEELYPDWVSVQRRAVIQRGTRTESLWLNQAAADRVHGLFALTNRTTRKVHA